MERRVDGKGDDRLPAWRETAVAVVVLILVDAGTDVVVVAFLGLAEVGLAAHEADAVFAEVAIHPRRTVERFVGTPLERLDQERMRA